MILVFGGTTEGRIAAETLERAGKPFFYSTKDGVQEIKAQNAVCVSGAMDADKIRDFVSDQNIRLIVDAAHPFAVRLHSNIADVCRSLGIDCIRFSRRTLESRQGAVYCESFADALNRIHLSGTKSLLALTGVQTIPRFKDLMRECKVIFRVLDRKESIEKALAEGVKAEHLIFYDENDPGAEKALDMFHPDAIITKESGHSGGLEEKLKVAEEREIPIYVVRMPRLQEATEEVFGSYGLRMAVERLLPGFFDLRIGFTTGSCATAAAMAAMKALLTGNPVDRIEFTLPDGEPMEMKVIFCKMIQAESWKATVIKDAGDDPDVTDGCRITAVVNKTDGSDIEIAGGEGVGRVTLPGLGIAVGEAAINPAPRKMIVDNIRSIYPEGGLRVEISVADGREIATRTFNAKVGVIGGLSILGTSGIVMPFSHEAFVESIRRELSVAVAAGVETIVINSGAKSESKLKAMFPELPPFAFIHYGNAIGQTLEAAEKAGVKRLIMGIMIGKAVKMAEGHLDTHSHNVRINIDFIASLAEQTGVTSETIARIRQIKLARELWDIVPPDIYPDFYAQIQNLCLRQASQIFTSSLEIHLLAD